MLNLLKFKEFSDYDDGLDKHLSGAEAYDRYAVEVTKMINEVGGKIVFEGEASTLVIGNSELQWDSIGIVNTLR